LGELARLQIILRIGSFASVAVAGFSSSRGLKTRIARSRRRFLTGATVLGSTNFSACPDIGEFDALSVVFIDSAGFSQQQNS
jgi:hypothetical protein